MSDPSNPDAKSKRKGARVAWNGTCVCCYSGSEVAKCRIQGAVRLLDTADVAPQMFPGAFWTLLNVPRIDTLCSLRTKLKIEKNSRPQHRKRGILKLKLKTKKLPLAGRVE